MLFCSSTPSCSINIGYNIATPFAGVGKSVAILRHLPTSQFKMLPQPFFFLCRCIFHHYFYKKFQKCVVFYSTLKDAMLALKSYPLVSHPPQELRRSKGSLLIFFLIVLADFLVADYIHFVKIIDF